MDQDKKKKAQFSATYFIVMFLVMWAFQELFYQPLLIQMNEVPYSRFRADLDSGLVQEVTFKGDRIFYTVKDTSTVEKKPEEKPVPRNTIPVEDPDLTRDLLDAGVTFGAKKSSEGLLTTLLGWALPFLPLILIWYYIFSRMGKGGPGVMSIGRSKAKEIAGEMTGVKFEDVGGVEEVMVELKEIIDFLKNPDDFRRIGAKLPKGVLLVGPPGTGKTLLAKATAGEAGVPFFSISGSEFVEMFVGVGAARVRDLFEQAKKKAPCIVFIDEIDAIGQARSTVARLGSNDEREQTLNQLLTEMDGFESNQGVVIMAATNRPEILDPALLRPGRFDRQIQVPLPAENGRRRILEIHTKNVQLADDVDLDRLAQITPGFSGADLANVVNEAALLAVRRKSDKVTMADFEGAIERVIAGLQRKVPLKDDVKRKVAYHEGGHALVAQVLPKTDPVHKVSIIPTAKGALGYTMQMPEEDQVLLGKEELLERLAVLLGGRAAELLVFDEPSTGAANDLERATEIARRMVTEYGMSETLGPVRYAQDAGMGFLGTQTSLRSELSPETEAAIDREVKEIVGTAQKQALSILQDHEKHLHKIAEVLIEREVISGDEIKKIVGNEKLKR